MRARAILLGALGTSLLTGCWNWNLSRDSGIRAPGRPKSHTKTNSGNPTQTVPSTRAGLADQDTKEDRHETELEGKLTVDIRLNLPKIAALESQAAVRLAIPVGFRGHPTGLAEIAAMSLTDLADPDGGRPTLRTFIADLGGALSMDVGPHRTNITVRVPETEWSKALRAIVARIRARPLDQSQFLALQDQLVRTHLERRGRDAFDYAAHWLRYGGRSHKTVVDEIQDRYLEEVLTFRSDHFRRQGTTVGLWVPAVSDATPLVTAAQEALADWTDAAATPAPAPAPVSETAKPVDKDPTGARWIEGAGSTQVAILLPVSDARPEWIVMIEIVTMGGLGGRLGTALERRLGFEPVFQVREVGTGVQRHLALSAAVPPASVPEVWNATLEAWNSLDPSPPSGKELSLAIGRAHLHLARRHDQADGWFDATSLRADRAAEGGPVRDLEFLAKLRTKDLLGSLAEWIRRQPAMVVKGGTIPEAAATAFEKVVLEPVGNRATDAASAEQEAESHLAIAVEALGDRRTFMALPGFEVLEVWRDSEGLAVEATTEVRPPGQIDRTLEVLGVTIKTSIRGDSGTETAGGPERTLTTREVGALRREVARHPVVLLSEWVRKKTKFRFLGERTHHGRTLALLERVDLSQPRLRISIETRSGLLRIVESVQERPEIGHVLVRDTYDDYREVAGLRVPMHRVTTLGNAPETVDSTVKSFQLKPLR